MKKPVASVKTEPGELPSELSDVMLLPEAAAFLRCHPETLRKMAKAGQVPAFRAGSGRRFSRKALTEWMQSRDSYRTKGAA